MTSVQTIRMGYLQTDDRLLMDFVYPDETKTLTITRRITRGLILGLAQILAQSNPVMARVPVSHKTDMLVWEHLSALQTGAAGGSPSDQGEAQSQPPRKPGPWPLLIKLDINTHPTAFELNFEATDGLRITLSVSRNELHRWLANLRQMARLADWDLDAAVGWLVEADAPPMHPGNLAS